MTFLVPSIYHPWWSQWSRETFYCSSIYHLSDLSGTSHSKRRGTSTTSLPGTSCREFISMNSGIFGENEEVSRFFSSTLAIRTKILLLMHKFRSRVPCAQTGVPFLPFAAPVFYKIQLPFWGLWGWLCFKLFFLRRTKKRIKISKIEWDLTNKPLSKLLELLAVQWVLLEISWNQNINKR